MGNDFYVQSLELVIQLSEQHFILFIGFQNKVSTNICAWSDGLISDVRVRKLSDLNVNIKMLLERYNHGFHLHHLDKLTQYSITEHQFV